MIQDGHCLAVSSSVETQATSSQNAITRKAGGRKEAEKEMQVHHSSVCELFNFRKSCFTKIIHVVRSLWT